MSDIDDFFEDRQAAREATVVSIDANPDNAARALQLSRLNGVAPLAVDNDLDRWERDTKSQMAGEIIANNPALQSYVNSNPMAPRVSNDDWASLDGITNRVARLSAGLNSTLIKTVEAFAEGSEGPRWINSPKVQEDLAKMPAWQAWLNYHQYSVLSAPLDVISKVAGGLTHAAPALVKSTYGNVTGDWNTAERLGREAGGFMEYLFNRVPEGVAHGPLPAILANRELRALADSTGPYLRAGEEPPPLINPDVDKMKKEQAKIDGDELKDLFSEVQKSTTRERAPDLFADMLRQQTNAKIHIPFDAIAKLYGDKLIDFNDGLLGWVPDIQAQVRTMSMTGGDIVIPLADWLAKVDPEVARDLHDNIRVRRGGFTIEEGKVLSELTDIDVYHGSPHSFEAFSMEKVGTGEGAQSYGHGLYFAQNRSVAESYAIPRSPSRGYSWVDVSNNLIAAAQGDRVKAAQLAEVYARENKLNVKQLQEILDEIKTPPASIYRARIHAEPEQFLDWYKPLSEQPNIQEALKNFSLVRKDHTGESLYRSIGITPENASKVLREAGIPGIRYLDQGSRQRTKIDIQKDIDALEKVWEDFVSAKGLDENTAQVGENIRRKMVALRDEQKHAPEKQTYNYVLFDDSLVEILDRNGEAVQAVRNQAGLEPLGDLGEPRTDRRGRRLIGGEDRYYGLDTKAYVKPTEKYTLMEMLINREVDKVLERIVPAAERQGVHKLEFSGREVQGGFLEYKDRPPIILWALTADEPTGTARHEAIHFLRRGGYFTDAEWNILKEAAIKEDWAGAHNLDTRYAHIKDPEVLLEEAIAEQYGKVWSKDPKKVSEAVNTVFEKLRMILVLIKERLEQVLGHAPTVDELFSRVESGEIGSRTGVEPRHPEAYREPVAQELRKGEQGELDVTRQSDKAIFTKAAAIGMTVNQYKRYLKLIEKRNLEDITKQRERAIELEKKRQSAEWKEESAVLEDQVRKDLSERPDIAAVNFFRYGELFGEPSEGRKATLDRAQLTREQEAALPKQWVSDKGMHPDDAAGLFGYTSGDALVDAMAAHETARGNIRPGEFFNRQVKAETERRMIERHGELDSNILKAAEDHVLGVTQMDLLHEETVALGMRSGSEISFTKADVQKWTETRFNELPAKSVDVVRLLNEAGKAGKAAELALLKGDFAEAFRQKQRQYLSAMMAKEAKGFEKETARFERLADRFSKREGPKSVEQEFTDAIQGLLLEAGYPVRRTPAEISEAMSRHGFDSMQDFVDARVNDGWELAVQPWLLEGRLRQYADNLTVEQTRDFRAALHSLNHVGREIRSIELAGEKMLFDQFRDEVINNIRSMPLQPKRRGLLKGVLFGLDAELVRMEEIVKDLDLRKELGPLFNALIRPMAEAKHTEFSMLEQLAKRFNEIQGANKKWQRTLGDNIPQDFFRDPNGTPFDLTRESMIGIMLNFGNRSNIEKFTKGWAGKDGAEVFERQLRGLFDRHATKEDWDFVQNIWNTFDMWRREANEMYYQLSGVPPKWIDPEPFTTRHGDYAGGYFPVLRDHYWADTPHETNIGLFGHYHRSTPANHYTKERRGAFYPVEFQESIEQVASRMQQEIHDISYRRALIAAKKVIDDKSIRAAIRQHYGAEYEKQMPLWLQKIASHFQIDEQATSMTNNMMRRFRYNLVIATLPLNLRVVLSPDVGMANPVSFSNAMLNHGETRAIAYEKSKEIPHTFRNMDRDFREQLDNIIKAHGFSKLQADATKLFFTPALALSQQFRMTTFVTEYNRRIAQGMSEGDAIAAADSLVREQHGAAGIADLPAIMTGSEAMKTFTVFYGYFNTMYNWQRQLPGNIRRGEYGNFIKNFWGSVIVGSLFGAALFNQQKEGDSWWKVVGKALALQPLSTVPFLRDAANYAFEGYQPRSPIASVIQAAGSAMTDVRRAVLENKKVTKPISHGANVLGLGLGVPGMAQIGRTSQFLYDVQTGRQRPRNFTEYMRGVISGEARLKK